MKITTKGNPKQKINGKIQINLYMPQYLCVRKQTIQYKTRIKKRKKVTYTFL